MIKTDHIAINVETFPRLTFPVLGSSPLAPVSPDRCRIILVRHGESTSNKDAKKIRIAGRKYDVPLTDEGIKQAEQVAQLLQKVNLGQVQEVHHSPLLRAQQTAQAIVKQLKTQDPGLNPPLLNNPALIETHYGELEGASAEVYDPSEAAMEADIPALPSFLEKMQYRMTIDGKQNPTMETGEDVVHRVDQTILQISKKNFGNTVLCVTHNGPVKYRYMQAMWDQRQADMEYPRIGVGNGAALVLESDGNKITCVATSQISWRPPKK